MNIRTTNLGTSNSMVAQIMSGQVDLLNLQLQMSTQKKINKPSDDSVGTSQILTINAQQEKINMYNTNVSTAKEQLDMLDSSLGNVIDVTQRAYDLNVQASNETYGSAQLKAIKGEIDQIMSSIVDFANTQYNGQYIFAGNNTAEPAYKIDSATGDINYNGSSSAGDSSRSIEIMEGVSIPLNVNGVDIFGSYKAAVMSAGGVSVPESATGLFGSLKKLSNALGSGDYTTIRDQLAGIKSGLDNVNNIRTQYGAYSSKRLDMTASYLSDLSVSLTEQKSNVQDIDLVKSLTDMNNKSYAYQASLQAASKSMNLSLLNYM